MFEQNERHGEHHWRAVHDDCHPAFQHFRGDYIGFFACAHLREQGAVVCFQIPRDIGRLHHPVHVYRVYAFFHLVHHVGGSHAVDITYYHGRIRILAGKCLFESEFRRFQLAAEHGHIYLHVLHKAFARTAQHVGHGRFLYASGLVGALGKDEYPLRPVYHQRDIAFRHYLRRFLRRLHRLHGRGERGYLVYRVRVRIFQRLLPFQRAQYARFEGYFVHKSVYIEKRGGPSAHVEIHAQNVGVFRKFPLDGVSRFLAVYLHKFVVCRRDYFMKIA